jgi:hypothetical protein
LSRTTGHRSLKTGGLSDVVVLEHTRESTLLWFAIEQTTSHKTGGFSMFEDILEKIISSEKQRHEARKISAERNVPKGDALHAIMAGDYSAILVSRDKHFRQLKDISDYHRPEELI